MEVPELGRRSTLRVLVAPNAFKECLTAKQAAAAIVRGVRRACPSARLTILPVADGGDGTLDVLGLPMRGAVALDPLGRRGRAQFGYDARRHLAVVELAEASGLRRLRSGERDALRASTDGTGDLIRAALDAGARHIIVGVGGSATTDGGTGIARALGVRFLDARGRDLPPGGGPLASLARIDTGGLDSRLRRVRIVVACDVTNPLLGPRGAARVFAPQKGASSREVRLLERALATLARVIRRGGGPALGAMPRAGAAGGSAAGLHALLGARLADGADVVLDSLGFDRCARGADLVLTGEGKVDATTGAGKAPAVVAGRALRGGTPTVALCGFRACSSSEVRAMGLTAALAIPPGPADVRLAMRSAATWLSEAAEGAVSIFRAGRG